MSFFGSMSAEETAEPTFASGLSPEELADLRRRGQPRHFRRGASLFNEGDRSGHVALITDGRVKVFSPTAEGKEILLAIRGPGDLLGDLSAIDREPRSATATAFEDVDAVIVSAEGFRDFLHSHPRITIGLLETLTRRLRDADRKRIEFAAFDSVGRVALRLVELAERFGEKDEDGIRIDLSLSQEELAGWTGASREAVSKALTSMRARGWIETRRRGITVLDLDALVRRST